MKRLAKEPLFHFFLLGTILFGIYQFTSKKDEARPKRIVVTQAQIARMAAVYQGAWGHPPSPAQLDQQIDDYVRNEICYREAMALGLDRDDPVIRGELRQKLEAMAEAMAAPTEPSDEDLRTFLQAHPERFRNDRWFTFDQIYLNPQTRRDTLAGDAARLLEQLNQSGAQPDFTRLGDSLTLAHSFQHVSSLELVNQFSESFSAKVGQLPAGRWAGPIDSPYGAHLIRVNDRNEGELPPLKDVRENVRREWTNDRTLATRDAFYQSLRKQYTVDIEQPKSGLNAK